MPSSFFKKLQSSLVTEYRVITALMLRETHTIYGHSSLGYLWVVIQSIFGIAIFWGLREFMKAPPPHGMPIAYFFILGFGIWSIISGAATKCMNAVEGNRTLLTFPQVTELDVMISRTFVLWFTQVIVSLVLILAANAVHDDLDIYSIGNLYIVIALSPLLGLGIGLTLSSFAVFLPTIERIVPIVFRILFFSSGVFFSASTFSYDIREILIYNPILQIIELARSSMFYGYPADGCSFGYIGTITLILLSFGLLLERYVRPRRKV